MSYRNPKQIVDTQSGQYVRDMQKSLSDTFSKYSSGINTIIDKKAKKLEEQLEEEAKSSALFRADRAKYNNKVSSDINQLANKNKSISFESYSALLEETSAIKMKPNYTWDQTDRNKINNGNTLGTDTSENIANTVSVGIPYIESRGLPLYTEGAIYSGVTSNGEERTPEQTKKHIDSTYLKYDILYGYGNAPGSKSMTADTSGLKTEFVTNIYDENDVQIGSVRNSTMDSLDAPVIIPKERKNMERLVEETAANMNLDSITSEAYKGQESTSAPLSDDVSNTKFQTSRKPSRDLFLKLAYPTAFANINSLQASGAIAYNNDILAPKGYSAPIRMRKTWVGGTEEQIAQDKKDKESIAKAYAELAADTVGFEVLNKSKDFGITVKPTGESGDSVVETGKAFYDKVKENPISSLIEYTEVKGVYDEANNTITINATDRKGYDGDEDLVFNMNDPDSRIDFYTRLFKASGAAGGGGRDAKLMRKQFSEALRTGTKEKLSKKPGKDDFGKFADKWDKENPGPYNKLTRNMQIMEAYDKSNN